jgi:mRNA-degrading endonuclease RelE of RelBE toxin-antitoxin system
MEIIRTDDFLKDFRGLPKAAQRFLSQQERRFIRNRFDPRLHIKKLKELAGAYSFRVTRRYRVLFLFRGGKVVFFAVGHRKDVYR